MSFAISILIILIWIGIFHLKQNRVSLTEEQRTREFWNRERKANEVRRQDISNLPYIQVPVDSLPLSLSDNAQIQEFQTVIEQLSDKKILNLTGISNTELKLQYGPSNLETLTEYDSNFTTLVRTISNWGQCLYELGQITEARTVLEYGISCKTDIKNNYILLAKIYKDSHETSKITDLIATAESLNTLMKSSIISSLQALQNSNSD